MRPPLPGRAVEVVPGVFVSSWVARSLCRAQGHVWSVWIDDGRQQRRWCRLCGAREVRATDEPDVAGESREGE